MSSPAQLPRPVPIVGFRGADRVFRVTVTKADDSGRQDLTGATMEFQVKTAPGVADPALISKSVGAGITLLAQAGATLGQADLALASADTSGATTPAGKYSYDLVATIGGKRRVIIPPSDFTLKDVVNQA